jgi:hypothetical protein
LNSRSDRTLGRDFEKEKAIYKVFFAGGFSRGPGTMVEMGGALAMS